MLFEPIECARDFVAQLREFFRDFDAYAIAIWFQRERETDQKNAKQLAEWRVRYSRILIIRWEPLERYNPK